MHTPRLLSAALVLATAALLSACGGGSDDNDASVGPPPLRPAAGAEGRWAGRSATGYDVLLTILDNGETWGLYTRGPVIHGALHGTSSWAGGPLRGSAAVVDYERDGQVSSSVYEGSFERQRLIQVGFSFDMFSGSYLSGYDRPATVAAIAGNYVGSVGGWPQPLALTVTADGQLLSTQPSPACFVRGSIGPRPGGQGIYDMRASFTGPGCPLPHGTGVAGIAVADGARLTLTSVAPSLVDFFVFQGNR